MLGKCSSPARRTFISGQRPGWPNPGSTRFDARSRLARGLLGPFAMWQDLIVAIRTCVTRPGYAGAVVVTLALGIGASTMMFSLVDAALLRPLPFEKPDALVMLTGVYGPERAPRGGSFPEIADWRRMNATLQDVALYDEMSLNLRIGDDAVRVDAELVSPSYFSLLGATAVRGRTFLPEEDSVPDKHAVAVVSERLWRDRLGSDPAGPRADGDAQRSTRADRRRHACAIRGNLVRHGRLDSVDDDHARVRAVDRAGSRQPPVARARPARGPREPRARARGPGARGCAAREGIPRDQPSARRGRRDPSDGARRERRVAGDGALRRRAAISRRRVRERRGAAGRSCQLAPP